MTSTFTRTHTFTRTDLVKPLVKALLENPLAREWSLQGFGQLRTYLDDDHNLRLHVWDNAFRTEAVDSIHTHPWHFHSYVVAGVVNNVRYDKVDGPISVYPRFREQEILCGPGGHETEVSDTYTCLRAGKMEEYKEGDTYSQLAHEIHASDPLSGTVTIIQREFLEDTEHAYVYIPQAQGWASAEPRPATPDEVATICGCALSAWF